MNPIEHAWDLVKRSTQRENPPQNAAELRLAVTAAWQQLPQNIINQLVLSMPRRVAALLVARGAYTRYGPFSVFFEALRPHHSPHRHDNAT